MSVFEFVRQLRSFRFNDFFCFKNGKVLSPMQGIESQMVVGSFLSLVFVSAVRVLLSSDPVSVVSYYPS